ncbi:MAG: hypothetical protein LW855_00740 [Alphaproteobacteria bacterium]|jgi:hypothetical protein|nr:hypothetical protein [Alphaproteobacteria bacterium]
MSGHDISLPQVALDKNIPLQTQLISALFDNNLQRATMVMGAILARTHTEVNVSDPNGQHELLNAIHILNCSDFPHWPEMRAQLAQTWPIFNYVAENDGNRDL